MESILLDSKEQKEQIVSFTEVASNKLQEIMKEQNSEESYLRVSITENPNGGFEYVFGLIETPEKDDIVVDSIIKTVVDPDSVKFVEGSNIDYVEGFQRSGFVISNPNFQSGGGCGGGSCGCGGGQAENSSSEQHAQGGGCGGGSCGCGGGQAENSSSEQHAQGGGCGGGSCGCGGGQPENSSSEQQAQGGCCGGASASEGQSCCQG